jgi:hypothetical protein
MISQCKREAAVSRGLGKRKSTDYRYEYENRSGASHG